MLERFLQNSLSWRHLFEACLATSRLEWLGLVGQARLSTARPPWLLLVVDAGFPAPRPDGFVLVGRARLTTSRPHSLVLKVTAMFAIRRAIFEHQLLARVISDLNLVLSAAVIDICAKRWATCREHVLPHYDYGLV